MTKKSLLYCWNRNEGYAHKLVADLTAEQMVMQPAPGTNHPAWILCHLNAYFPVLVSLLKKEAFEDPKDHPFGMQSKPTPDAAVYPAKETLIAEYSAGHESVAAALQAADDDIFESPQTLERWKEPMPLVGMALSYLMLVHESLHLGQLSAWRRVQGLPPV